MKRSNVRSAITIRKRPPRQTREQIYDHFNACYGSLKTPLCLCSGLEIIAANRSCLLLLDKPRDQVEGRLINTFLSNSVEIDALLEGQKDRIIAALKNEDENSHVELSQSSWGHPAHFRLLEWRDLQQVRVLETALRTARDYSSATNALLPEVFARSLDVLFSAYSSDQKGGKTTAFGGLLMVVTFDHGQSSNLGFTDQMAKIVELVRQTFGPETLICENRDQSLHVYTPSGSDEQEARYIMKQMQRICRDDGNAPKVGACLFPDHGSSLKEIESNLNLVANTLSANHDLVLFDEDIRTEANRIDRLSCDMAAAIKSNQITPYFQPVIHAKSGHIKGFEALVRWIHPELGYVIPPDIIAIATKTGQLDRLTAHVMEQAIEQLQNWPDYVQIAVNVTPSQLTPDLIDMVRTLIRRADIDPGRFEIEITEDALISDFKASSRVLARLRAIGITIAMDDFGAGYTSVGNLRKLEFTKIKIDKVISDGLPHDPKSVSIVKSLMFMAKELGLHVTVEGIEEQEQLDLLKAYDCGIQGYVFSPPLPVERLSEMKKYLRPHHLIVVRNGKRINNPTFQLHPDSAARQLSKPVAKHAH